MKDRSRDLRALSTLTSMPFLDRLEIAAVSGISDRTIHDAVTSLHRRGLAGSVRHATELIAPTTRFHVTEAGLRLLAEAEGMTVDDIVRLRPVSAHMRRILLDRLDAVGVVYRVASSLAALSAPLRFRWYRAMPLDAAMTLPDGRTVGIVRQGLTSERTAFSERLWRLLDGSIPSALLVVVPDAVRLRRAGRLLARARMPVFLALERDAALSGEDDAVWRMPSVSAPIDLRYVMSLVRRRGGLPVEPRPSRALVPDDLDAARGLDRPPRLSLGAGSTAHSPETLGEARARHAVRLAVDRVRRPRRHSGSHPATALPGRVSAGRLRAAVNRRQGPSPSNGPQRRGIGPAGPQGPCGGRRCAEAVERRADE